MTLEERVAALEAALADKADVATIDVLVSRTTLLESTVSAMADEAADLAMVAAEVRLAVVDRLPKSGAE